VTTNRRINAPDVIRVAVPAALLEESVVPYVHCPHCFVRIYSAAVHSQRDDCPRCFTPLVTLQDRTDSGRAQPRYVSGPSSRPGDQTPGDLASV
jgi:hypothetical protein